MNPTDMLVLSRSAGPHEKLAADFSLDSITDGIGRFSDEVMSRIKPLHQRAVDATERAISNLAGISGPENLTAAQRAALDMSRQVNDRAIRDRAARSSGEVAYPRAAASAVDSAKSKALGLFGKMREGATNLAGDVKKSVLDSRAAQTQAQREMAGRALAGLPVAKVGPAASAQGAALQDPAEFARKQREKYMKFESGPEDVRSMARAKQIAQSRAARDTLREVSSGARDMSEEDIKRLAAIARRKNPAAYQGAPGAMDPLSRLSRWAAPETKLIGDAAKNVADYASDPLAPVRGAFDPKKSETMMLLRDLGRDVSRTVGGVSDTGADFLEKFRNKAVTSPGGVGRIEGVWQGPF